MPRKKIAFIGAGSFGFTRKLVNDLLTLQRIENDPSTTELKRVNLRSVAQGVVDTLHPILEERGANVEITGEGVEPWNTSVKEEITHGN